MLKSILTTFTFLTLTKGQYNFNDDLFVDLNVNGEVLEFTVTKRNANGWFAVAFPENEAGSSMIGATGVFGTQNEDTVRVYDIESQSPMQSSWRKNDFLIDGKFECLESSCVLTFSIPIPETKTLDLLWAFKENIWDPEDVECWHGSNRGRTVVNIPSYVFVNLFQDDEMEAVVASVFDYNTVTLPDGTTTVLMKGSTAKFPILLGGVVKTSKPANVYGIESSSRWSLSGVSHNRGRVFGVVNYRQTPRLVIYAVETANVKITVKEEKKDMEEVFSENKFLTKGEFYYFKSEEDYKSNMMFVHSDADVLVSYWANGETDYINLVPGGQEFYALASTSGRILSLTQEPETLTFQCSDGSTKVKENFVAVDNPWYGNHFVGPACKVTSTGMINAHHFADGDGGNAASYLSSSSFGQISVAPIEFEFIVFTSDVSANCLIDSTSYSLEGETGVYKVKTGFVPKGSIIECDAPVMAMAETNDRDDESNLEMFSPFSDPCDLCSEEEQGVCADGEDWQNACLARCNGKINIEEGFCLEEPETEPPTTTTTTTTPPPELDEDGTITALKNIISELTMHQILQENRQEHGERSQGSSGITRVRAYRDGYETQYADGGIASGGVIRSHNHPNGKHIVGLGEFGAVLNGVRFDTRHNDYSLSKPAQDAQTKYNALEKIEFPPVPESVSDLDSVDAQIAEMQEYFRAFHEQDTSRRDYRNYFKPVLCYLEGAWKLATDDLEDPFHSDRHEIEAATWEELHNKVSFIMNSGKKRSNENVPYLPTKVIGIRVDNTNGITYPVFANFEYRIACQPIKNELPLERFDYDIPENLRAYGSNSQDNLFKDEDFANTRQAKFRLNPLLTSDWEFNKSKNRKQKPRSMRYGRNFLDELMEQIPGKDGPGAELFDDSFGDKTREYRDFSSRLNTGYYNRFFSLEEADAMGRNSQMRGYSDLNLWAAMTTHPSVAGQRVCQQYKGRTTECEGEWLEQKWTYAIPLEIVYLTPLGNWNPCKLKQFDSPSAWNEANEETDGTMEKPIIGYSDRNNFLKTPARFFTGEGGRDLADTGAGYYAQGEDDDICYVVPSGIRIVLDPIQMGDEAKQVRLRYPIFKMRDRTSLAYREVQAVNRHLKKELSDLQGSIQQLISVISSSGSFDGMKNSVQDLNDGSVVEIEEEDMVGRFTEKTYPVNVKLSSGPGSPSEHSHKISCDWICFSDLMNGESVSLRSEMWEKHDHLFTFKLGANGHLEFLGCDNCAQIGDLHQSILPDMEHSNLFN